MRCLPRAAEMTSSRWNDLRLARKGLVVAVLPISALLVGFAALYGLSAAERRAQSRIERTLEVRNEIGRGLTGMVATESAVRGFVVTRDPEFLEAAKNARENVTTALARL